MLNPLPASKWNYTTAAHLLNRAGFGGTPAEIEKLAELGPEKAVSRLVDYERIPDNTPPPDWARPDSELMQLVDAIRKLGREVSQAKSAEERKALDQKRREMIQAERREQQRHINDLRGWWLERMVKSPRPLQEKLTLFWHGHFATSVQKVRYAYFMYLQNQTLRQFASGNWHEMLVAMAKDPAMLVWLDQGQSRKERPNENFARELMELFALGEGNYTEKDVTEAARALTGFTLNRYRQEYEYRPSMHDSGTKTILGETGALNGMDVIRIVANHPQSARFISEKLWRFFADENPSPQLVDALASILRKNNKTFKPLLRAMFRSEEFYSESIIRNQVKSPVQWLVGSVRMLERELPDTTVAAQLLRTLGQDLFAPPNVKGWDGGLNWITTNNLLHRYNASALLVLAKVDMPESDDRRVRAMQVEAKRRLARMPAVDVDRILSERERRDKEAVIPALEKRLLQARLKEKQRQVLRDYLDTRGTLDDDDIRHTIRLLMATPEYQLT